MKNIRIVISSLFLIIAVKNMSAQNQDQMFVTETNLYGLIYVKKGNIVNQSFDLMVSVDWVDRNLRRLDDKNSCIVLVKDSLKKVLPDFIKCVSFEEAGNEILTANESLRLRFIITDEGANAPVVFTLPFLYASTPESAGETKGRTRFFYTHPEKLEVIYDLSTGTAMDFINEAEVTVTFSGISDPNNNNRIDAGETVSIQYTVKNQGSKPSGEIVLIINETNHIEGLTMDNTHKLTALAPGAEKKISVKVVSSKEIANAEASFRLVAHAEGAEESFVLNHTIAVRAEIKEGRTFELKNVYFEYNQATLVQESHRELDNLVEVMLENKGMQIEIAGHTDSIGGASYNQNLSQQRADAVANYLVSKKIDKTRIVSKGYGESKPIDTNETEEGRARNRRVEFVITRK